MHSRNMRHDPSRVFTISRSPAQPCSFAMPRATCAFLVVLVGALLAVATLAEQSEEEKYAATRWRVNKKVSNLHEQYVSDKKVKQKLDCEICAGIAQELHGALRQKRHMRMSKLPIDDGETIFEEHCTGKRMQNWGLLFQNDSPTMRMCSDPVIMHTQGDWSGRLMMEQCGEWHNERSDEILDMFEDSCTVTGKGKTAKTTCDAQVFQKALCECSNKKLCACQGEVKDNMIPLKRAKWKDEL